MKIRSIRDCNRKREMYPLPEPTNHIEGSNLRGTILPILNLRAKARPASQIDASPSPIIAICQYKLSHEGGIARPELCLLTFDHYKDSSCVGMNRKKLSMTFSEAGTNL